MSASPQNFPQLPILEVMDEVQNVLQSTNTLILKAPPGAGKSTLLPLLLMEEEWLQGKKIIMLEPRRLAAKSIAYRMADLCNDRVGDQIGYRVRFDTKVSKATKIEVVTEGILTRMIQSDNSLNDIGLVIFDEFHERSLHADVALAFCREVQEVLRPDLRILVMSATLNMPELSNLLNCKVIESKGRQFPVDVIYTGTQDELNMAALAAQTVLNAVEKHDGDVLVFFPGQAQIKSCEAILKKQLTDFEIHPLYGMLSPKAQNAAIMPSRSGKRKVVLATSIAETSLTIEGVKIVVDTGYGKKQAFDPNSGMSKLITHLIAEDAADQRSGRAGRLGPGVCYRMWSKATQAQLEVHRKPEILEAELSPLVLDLAHWGTNNLDDISWITPPPAKNIQYAQDLLEDIEALEIGTLTEHGREIHALPCHPRIAHMLIKARALGLLSLACDLAAFLEERDPMGRESGIDINDRIIALRNQRKTQRFQKGFKKIAQIAEQYLKMCGAETQNDIGFDPFDTGLLLSQAYPERIAHARPGNNAQFQMANGQLVACGHKEDLAAEPWLAIAQAHAHHNIGNIWLAAPLNPQDLQDFVKEREVIHWDTKEGKLIAEKQLRIGQIILKSSPIKNMDPLKKIEVLTQLIQKDGAHLLDFNKQVTQWQNRVLSLKKWNPEQNWPNVETQTLLNTNKLWLAPYLNEVKTVKDLQKLNLLDLLTFSLDYEQQQLLNQLAPAKIQVPSGAKFTLEYQENGQSPKLSARIQELFGLQDTPKVNQGKINVLVQLLSPGFKPVQLTSDLKNFWSETYFMVKKDLKGRYPKHKWPDDPLNG